MAPLSLYTYTIVTPVPPPPPTKNIYIYIYIYIHIYIIIIYIYIYIYIYSDCSGPYSKLCHDLPHDEAMDPQFNISQDKAHLVLGGEGCMWGETVAPWA